jgi:hypothetical protein
VNESGGDHRLLSLLPRLNVEGDQSTQQSTYDNAEQTENRCGHAMNVSSKSAVSMELASPLP